VKNKPASTTTKSTSTASTFRYRRDFFFEITAVCVVATEFLLLGLVFTLYRQNHFKKPNPQLPQRSTTKKPVHRKGREGRKGKTNNQNKTHHGDTKTRRSTKKTSAPRRRGGAEKIKDKASTAENAA
jgi:hypothetical protein